MFYASVRNHPLVDDNWHILTKGERIQTKAGSVYLVLRENQQDRSFIVRDDRNNTAYFAHRLRLTVVMGNGAGSTVSYTIPSPVPKAGKSLTELVDQEDVEHIDGLNGILETIMLENRQKYSLWKRSLKWFSDPAAKIFLTGLALYGILTVIVMVNDYLKS